MLSQISVSDSGCTIKQPCFFQCLLSFNGYIKMAATSARLLFPNERKNMGFDNTMAISGRLTRDPEIRDVGNSKVCNFRIAWNSKDKDGESVGHFFDCVAWNELAENIAEWRKGNRVVLHGRLTYSEWKNDNDEQRSATRITVEDAGLSVKWTPNTDGPAQPKSPGVLDRVPDEEPF